MAQQTFLTAPEEDRPCNSDYPNGTQEVQETGSVSRPGFRPTLWLLLSPLGLSKELLVFSEARVRVASVREPIPDHLIRFLIAYEVPETKTCPWVSVTKLPNSSFFLVSPQRRKGYRNSQP